MTDQKPETLPERNWEQEAISLIAAEAGYLVSVLTGIVEAYGLGRGFWSDAAVAIAVRECAARLQSESRVAELTRQVESLKQQLQGATANEQSMVNEEAHDRDELALLVQQKDALSVANETLRKALHLAQSELDYQYQTLCSSVCPPCKQGELYDYSELRPEERAEIDRVEAALDAVDAALAEIGE